MPEVSKLEPVEAAVNCQACSKYIQLPASASEGDEVECPFCFSKTRLRLIAVWIGDDPEASAADAAS